MNKIQLSKGVISRKEAVGLSPSYVRFVEELDMSDWPQFRERFNQLRKGQRVLTCHEDQFVIAKVSSIKPDWRNEDGPVVRVSNGEYSWRVDGDRYAVAI